MLALLVIKAEPGADAGFGPGDTEVDPVCETAGAAATRLLDVSAATKPHTGIGMAARKPVLRRLRGVWRCRYRQVVTAERHLYGDRDPVLETSKLPNSAGDRRFESISLRQSVRLLRGSSWRMEDVWLER